MSKFPKDCNSRVIGTAARTIFPTKLNPICWEHHELTGTDHGTDMIIEYVENEEFRNNKIQCQIKGTTQIQKYTNKNNNISYPINVKTINYGISSSIPFLIALVDVILEKVYIVTLQDYFIANNYYFEKIDKNKETINIIFEKKDILELDKDYELKQIAKSTYVMDYEKKKIIKYKNS